MSDQIHFKLIMGADLKTVTLQVEIEGGGTANAEMDGADLSGLIQMLVTGRASMDDPVPFQLDPGPQLPAVMPKDVRWWVYDPEDGMVPLAMRHPGIGWTGFLLPTDAARELAGWLLKAADQAQAPT